MQALVKIAEGHNDAAGRLAVWGLMVLSCLSEWHTEALARAGELVQLQVSSRRLTACRCPLAGWCVGRLFDADKVQAGPSCLL